ncbi:MAG: rRNA maturation RNase YbeY [Bdellovibrionota bacterium]
MIVRVALSFAEGRKASELPLNTTELRKLFRFVHAELKSTSLYTGALAVLGVNAIGSIGLHFCSDEEMRGLQKRYRKLDRTTDILSFPSLEVPGAREMMSHLPPSERSWGDMVVSMSTVERGAKRGRRAVREELAEVLIHGFLHLLGMDHIVGRGVSVKDARDMKALQRQLFKKWKML